VPSPDRALRGEPSLLAEARASPFDPAPDAAAGLAAPVLTDPPSPCRPPLEYVPRSPPRVTATPLPPLAAWCPPPSVRPADPLETDPPLEPVLETDPPLEPELPPLETAPPLPPPLGLALLCDPPPPLCPPPAPP